MSVWRCYVLAACSTPFTNSALGLGLLLVDGADGAEMDEMATSGTEGFIELLACVLVFAAVVTLHSRLLACQTRRSRRYYEYAAR